MIFVVQDNGYDAEVISEYTEDDFRSILSTGYESNGVVNCKDIQRDILSGDYSRIIHGAEVDHESFL